LGAAKTVFFRNINDVVVTVDKAETKWMKEKFQALVIRQHLEKGEVSTLYEGQSWTII